MCNWAAPSTVCWETTPGCASCGCWRRERLNVSELTGILGLAQSGVSRHLGMLKEAGLIAEQREGVYTWYRLSPRLQDADNGFGPLWPLLQAQFEATGQGRRRAGRRCAARGSAAAAQGELRPAQRS